MTDTNGLEISTKSLTLKEYYRHEFGKAKLIFIGIWSVVTLILVIVCMVYIPEAINVSIAAGNDPWDVDMATYYILWCLLGIVLIILVFVGMVYSQCVFFLLAQLWLDFNGLFIFILFLAYFNSFTTGLILWIVAGVISAPFWYAYRATERIRKKYKEITE